MEQNSKQIQVSELSPNGVPYPVAYIKDDIRYQGRIEKIHSDGAMDLRLYDKNLKNVTVPSTADVLPMFIISKDNTIVPIKFHYDEVVNALNKSETIKLEFNKETNPYMALMLGNKSLVIPFSKKIDNSFAPVEGRLEMKRDYKNGQASIDGNVKFKELILDRPIYGKVLDSNQKEQLMKTGELGLVDGFKTSSGTEYKLWVSLDTQLNKVVTARENDIYVAKIFGVIPNERQIEDIKSGKGILLEINDKNYFIQASAASLKANKLKSFTEEKAKEFKLIPDTGEKKNEKSKGLKLN